MSFYGFNPMGFITINPTFARIFFVVFSPSILSKLKFLLVGVNGNGITNQGLRWDS